MTSRLACTQTCFQFLAAPSLPRVACPGKWTPVRWFALRGALVIVLTIGTNCAAWSAPDYLAQIKPILRERCFACHGTLKQEGGLRLDGGALIHQGGDSGTAVQPGDSTASLLWQRVSSDTEGERMPPEGSALDAPQLALIEAWIEAGATFPADDVPEPSPDEHWAFQPPVAIAIPALDSPSSVPSDIAEPVHPVDALLANQRKSLGLEPLPEANRSVLLRRLSLDLIGLPPTPEQQRAFLADARPDAYERLVDSLLDRPEYGERWARHWMDVWRYSDWFGLGEQLRYSQKHIWHWRDWIIESLNANVGYDQMVRLMLAADEIAPEDSSQLRATGFLARNYFLFNRTTWLDNTIEHTSKAFLGLTMNCAKCHDHKYDPITQADYYALRAVFEPHQVRLDAVPGQTDFELDGLPRAFDAHPDAVTYVHVRGDASNPDKSRAIAPGPPAFLQPHQFQPQAIRLPPAAAYPQLQPSFWATHLQHAVDRFERSLDSLAQLDPHTRDGAESVAEQERLGKKRELATKQLQVDSLKLDRLMAIRDAELARIANSGIELPGELAAGLDVAALRDDGSRLSEKASHLSRCVELAEAELALVEASMVEDDAKRNEQEKAATDRLEKAQQALSAKVAGYVVPRASIKALEGPDEKDESRFADYPTQSTGRRLALADWIVDPSNPLTARVAVNHIWMRHLGQPLVDPVNDFGRRTPAPVQRELLDWLAVDFVQSGWDMKRLHRLIVTSKAYRLRASDAETPAHYLEVDPTNSVYWCRVPVRMEAQVLRDSLLWLAGQLDLTRGGPSISPNQDKPPFRRSLYFAHSRDDQHRFLSMFDDADIVRCYRREESIIPQQALALSNSRLAIQMADTIGQRIVEELSSDATAKATDTAVIETAFVWLLCRAPGDEERQACRRALSAYRALDPNITREKLAGHLVRVLINHNDFITIR